MSAVRFHAPASFPPHGVVSQADGPLSQWFDAQAAWYLAQGSEPAVFAARVLGDFAAMVRTVESPGAPPLAMDVALDRLAESGGMPGPDLADDALELLDGWRWALGPGPADDDWDLDPGRGPVAVADGADAWPF